MALNNIQERIERSIYEAIRLQLVAGGYWPDETLVDYSNNTTAWENAIKAITASKGSAIEPFGSSQSFSKKTKATPRIVIIPRRFMPGDIGNPVSPVIVASEDNPGFYSEVVLPQLTVDLFLDINLVSSSAKQERILNAILHAALGTRRYLKFYDQADKKFFIKQYNYYDIPDPDQGIEEKVYCYQVCDLYLEPTQVNIPVVPTIKEITIETALAKLNPQTTISEGGIHIDLSHIQYL